MAANAFRDVCTAPGLPLISFALRHSLLAFFNFEAQKQLASPAIVLCGTWSTSTIPPKAENTAAMIFTAHGCVRAFLGVG